MNAQIRRFSGFSDSQGLDNGGLVCDNFGVSDFVRGRS